MLNRKSSSPWSLTRSSDLTVFAMATAVGVGNFLTLPELVLYHGGLKVLLLHLLGLAVLGTPLVVGEILLARWLLRPLAEGTRALDRRLAIVPTVAFFATALIATAYAFELGRLIVHALRFLSLQGAGVPGLRFQILATREFHLGAAFVVLSLGAFLAARRPSRLLPWLRNLVRLSLCLWAGLALWVVWEWGTGGFGRLFYWDATEVTGDLLLRVSSFSLFTLSAGLGLIYNMTFYASQKARIGEENGATPFWAQAGRPLRVVGWVLVADVASSLASLVLVSPFGLSELGMESHPVAGDQLLLDWLPQVFSLRPGGTWAGALLLISLALAGLAAFLTLMDFAITNLQIEQKWSRRKAMFHIVPIGAVLLIPEIFPRIRPWIDHLGLNILLPLSALLIALVAGWGMPARAQRTLLGRGLLLDSFFLLWRVSIRILVPLVLMGIVVRSLSTL